MQRIAQPRAVRILTQGHHTRKLPRRAGEAVCPLVTLSGHPTCTDECPLSGVKRARREQAVMSANDPKQTFGVIRSATGQAKQGLAIEHSSTHRTITVRRIWASHYSAGLGGPRRPEQFALYLRFLAFASRGADAAGGTSDPPSPRTGITVSAASTPDLNR
jgi:hypothetical protein